MVPRIVNPMTEPAPAIVFSTETDATTPAPADEPEPEAQAEVVAEPEVAVPAEGATEDGTEAQTAAVTDNTDDIHLPGGLRLPASILVHSTGARSVPKLPGDH